VPLCSLTTARNSAARMDRTILLKGSFLHRRTFGWQDLIAVLIVVAAVILFGTGMHQMLVPLVPKHPQQISLSPTALPRYTLLTVLRMLAAMVASLIFTFTYATLAAKSRAPRWC